MRISRQFRRALESELRRLMEQGGASLVWEVKADHRAGAREMSRRLQQLGYPTKLSGNTVTLSVDPIEHSKMQALINRIQRGGMDVSYSLKFGPAPKYDRTLRRISAKEANWQKFKKGQRFVAGGKLYEVYNLSTGRQTVHAGRVGKDGKMLPPRAGNFLNLGFDQIDGLMKIGAVRLV